MSKKKEPILFYNGEPVAHGCVETREELLEVAWEMMGNAGYYNDPYSPGSTCELRDFDELCEFIDCHAGMETPITDIYDSDENMVSIVILISPFYHFELHGSDWWGYDGDEMEELLFEYCEEHGIDIEGD